MKEKVAIVGMGCVYPDASNIYEYWNNIYINKNVTLNTATIELDSRECDFVSEEIESNSIEKVFSLITAKEALVDAGLYNIDINAFDKEKIGVIISVSQDCDMCNSRKNSIVNSIMQKFDFKGISCTLAGTNANNLASIKFANDELQSMNADIMLAGEVSTEGVGIVVLKRLDDAKRDRDKIYAIIKSIGLLSEGTSNNTYQSCKQCKFNLYNKAYREAGISPKEVGILETNGTGKDTLDICEFSILSDIYRKESSRNTVIGNIKNENSNLNTTSSMAGFIKIALSLYHKILPASVYEEDVDEMIQNTSLSTIKKSRPWFVNDNNPKRYGAISVFEDAGVNYHIVLEEDNNKYNNNSLSKNVKGVMIKGITKEELIFKIEELLKGLKINSSMWHEDRYRYQPFKDGMYRLAFVASDATEVKIKCLDAINLLNELPQANWCKNGIIYSSLNIDDKKVAVLFAGQNLKNIDMMMDILKNNDLAMEYIKKADDIMLLNGLQAISEIMYGLNLTEHEENMAKDKMKNIANIEPILISLQCVIYGILKERGLKADYLIGHSFCELTALWADEAFDYETCIDAAIKRGAYIYNMLGNMSMLKVYTSIDILKTYMYKYDNVYIANENSTKQIVVSGNANEIEILMDELKLVGINTEKISVNGAYHSPYMVQAAEAFGKYLNNKKLDIPKGKAISSYSGEHYGSDVINTLVEQIINPVLYKSCVEKAYDEGARIFIEIGCKDDMYGLTKDIIDNRIASEKYDVELDLLYNRLENNVKKASLDKDYHIISLYLDDNLESVENLEFAMAKLAVLGINIKDNIDTYIPPRREVVKELELSCIHNTTNESVYIEEISAPKQVIIKNNLRSVDTLQTEVFTKFMDSQNYQINAISKMLENNKDKSLEAQKNVIDCISKFRDNSLDAFKIYFGEKNLQDDKDDVVWSEVVSDNDKNIVIDSNIRALEDKSNVFYKQEDGENK